jgi:hypothetical protein
MLCNTSVTPRLVFSLKHLRFSNLTLFQTQSRMRQEQQQAMLRGLRGDMMPQQYQQMIMRNGANGMNINQNQNELRQKAIQNNRNK